MNKEIHAAGAVPLRTKVIGLPPTEDQKRALIDYMAENLDVARHQ